MVEAVSAAACSARGQGPDLESIEDLIGAAGWDGDACRLLALSVFATLAAPATPEQAGRIEAAAAGLDDRDLLLEIAGVAFAFNTVNRVADARRVRLEYRSLRDLSPVEGWVERRFAFLTGLFYDLSYVHTTRHTPEQALARVDALSRERGGRGTPGLFGRLGPAPAVLDGLSLMLDLNVRDAGLAPELWTEAVAVAAASRSMTRSSLRPMVADWLGRLSLPAADVLAARATSGTAGDLESVCLRFAHQVANAAHTVTADDLQRLQDLGLSDPEVLDLVLGVSLFSALAAVEPLVDAHAPAPIGPRPPRAKERV